MSGLIEDPFDWRVTKDRRVLISRGGSQVSVVGGTRASRLIAELDAAVARDDPDAAQQRLARVTGNYKRGNERGGNAERSETRRRT